jgi:hypothetical protein
MSHRLQITLTDEQYALLRRKSAESGASIATLVRRALDSEGGSQSMTTEERLALLRESAGAWSDRRGDDRVGSGKDYVEAIRRR